VARLRSSWSATSSAWTATSPGRRRRCGLVGRSVVVHPNSAGWPSVFAATDRRRRRPPSSRYGPRGGGPVTLPRESGRPTGSAIPSGLRSPALPLDQPVPAGRPVPARARPPGDPRLDRRCRGSPGRLGVPGAPGSGGQRHRGPGPPGHWHHAGRWRVPQRPRGRSEPAALAGFRRVTTTWSRVARCHRWNRSGLSL
jgi:hypothetical protein